MDEIVRKRLADELAVIQERTRGLSEAEVLAALTETGETQSDNSATSWVGTTTWHDGVEQTVRHVELHRVAGY